MHIISRSQWGSRHGDGRYAAPVPVDEVWLHHSVTIAPDLLPPFDDDDAAILTIERIGAERFGAVYGFPYTFGITPVGRIYAGHNIAKTGARTAGHNSRGRGICLVGNYEDSTPPQPMLDALVWLLRHGHTRGWWRAPRLTGGHRDVKATACPGRHAYALIGEVNHRATQPPEDDMPTPAEFWDHPCGDPYIGPDGKPREPKPAHVLLSYGSANAAYAVEQAATARAELAALKTALPNMVAEEVRTALAQGVVDVDITVRDKTGE